MATESIRALSRVSIAWSGGKPSENTDTLVLTIKGYSVDLRMWAAGPHAGEIEWGMVGYVIDKSTPQKSMLEWDNIIDSRPAPPVTLPDEAAFSLLPDGNVLEVGRMFNPLSSEAEPYEEVWRREAVSGGYCVLERVGDGWGETEGATKRAFIGRLGVYTIAEASFDGEYVAYRDQRDCGEWKRLYDKDPRGVLPSLPDDVPDWDVGARVKLGDQEWVVRESGRV